MDIPDELFGETTPEETYFFHSLMHMIWNTHPSPISSDDESDIDAESDTDDDSDIDGDWDWLRNYWTRATVAGSDSSSELNFVEDNSDISEDTESSDSSRTDEEHQNPIERDESSDESKTDDASNSGPAAFKPSKRKRAWDDDHNTKQFKK